MKKINKKIAILALIGVLNATGCSDHLDDVATVKVESSTNDENKSTIEETTQIISENDLEHSYAQSGIMDYTTNVVTNSLEEAEELLKTPEGVIDRLLIESIDTAIANEDTNIISPVDNSTLGTFIKGRYLPIVAELDEYYVVNYYGVEGYVSKNSTMMGTMFDIKSPFNKVLYATQEIEMTIPENLSDTQEEQKVLCNKYECFEVYGEGEDFYIVGTDRNIGYIRKENVEELTGTFIVVNLSEQNLKMYKDNEIELYTRVCTGKPSSPTNEGIFAIYNITQKRYLVGPGYKTYVDYMLKFDGNIGLHDSDYHTNENGHKSGWRNHDEYGATNINGSHGCVNMMYDDVSFVYDNVANGTQVLVYSYK